MNWLKSNKTATKQSYRSVEAPPLHLETTQRRRWSRWWVCLMPWGHWRTPWPRGSAWGQSSCFTLWGSSGRERRCLELAKRMMLTACSSSMQDTFLIGKRVSFIVQCHVSLQAKIQSKMGRYGLDRTCGHIKGFVCSPLPHQCYIIHIEGLLGWCRTIFFHIVTLLL